MNRKILVGILIALAIGNIGTLIATGLLFTDANTSSSTNTTTLNTATDLTAVLSTTLIPRFHHQYKVELSVSMGSCGNSYGKVC